MKKVGQIDRNIESSNVISRLTPVLINKFITMIIERKRDFVMKLKVLDSMILSKMAKTNIKRIFRKYTLYYIKIHMKEVSKICRIMYLLKVIQMHKVILKKMFVKSVIRKWFVFIHLENVARRKMKTLYQNMQIQYLDTMNSIFNENEKNPGLLNEINRTVFSNFTTDETPFKYLMRNPLNYEHINVNEENNINTSSLNLSSESNFKSHNNLTLNETCASIKNTSQNKNNYNISGELSVNNDKQESDKGRKKVIINIKKGKR